MGTIKSVIFFVSFVILSGISGTALAELEKYFSAESVARGIGFYDDEVNNGRKAYGEIRFSPRMELYTPDDIEMVFSADFRAGLPETRIYQEGIELVRSDGEKPFFLLQEAYAEFGNGNLTFKQGRFKPKFANRIKFDYYLFSPVAQLDYSEPFLSLESDRLLGSWGGLVRYEKGITYELFGFYHEDPILATHDENPWQRKLPLGFGYGEFKSGQSIDWGFRLSQNWWEFSFVEGSANNPSHLEQRGPRRFDLVFPEQTSIQTAIQKPLGPFNLRAGTMQVWRSWKGDNAGEFLSAIVELEFAKEGVFRRGDNLFVEAGLADVWDTDDGKIFLDNLGMDQVYRGGSMLFTAEYSPREDWVLKLRTIFNFRHNSSYVAPQISKYLFADWGDLEFYARWMMINGSSDDVISAYSHNDNIEIGVKFFF